MSKMRRDTTGFLENLTHLGINAAFLDSRGAVLSANSLFYVYILSYSTVEQTAVKVRHLPKICADGGYSGLIDLSDGGDRVFATIEGELSQTSEHGIDFILMFNNSTQSSTIQQMEIKRNDMYKTLLRSTVFDQSSALSLISGYIELLEDTSREKGCGDIEDFQQIRTIISDGMSLLKDLSFLLKGEYQGTFHPFDQRYCLDILRNILFKALGKPVVLEDNASSNVAEIRLGSKFLEYLEAVLSQVLSIDKSETIESVLIKAGVESTINEPLKNSKGLIINVFLSIEKKRQEDINLLDKEEYCTDDYTIQLTQNSQQQILILSEFFLSENSTPSFPPPHAEKSRIGDSLDSGTILVVDDEESVLDVMVQRLRRLGYTPVGTTSPLEALSWITQEKGKFSLLMTDQVMPELTGLGLCKKVHEIAPEMPIIMVTGYTSGVTKQDCKQHGIVHLLMKPLAGKECAATISSTLKNSLKRSLL